MSNTLLNDLYNVCSAWEKFKAGDKAEVADAAADCFSFETADEKARFATFCAGYMFGAPDQTEPTTDNGSSLRSGLMPSDCWSHSEEAEADPAEGRA